MHRYQLHKLSSFDLATGEESVITLIDHITFGQKWDACSVRKETAVKDQAELEPATTGLKSSHTEVLLCKQELRWNLAWWSEIMYDFKAAAAKDKKGRWYLMALSSKDLEISTWVAHFCWWENQALDHSVDCYGYTSRQVKIVALESFYCHTALLWLCSLGTARTIWKRWTKQRSPATISITASISFLSKPVGSSSQAKLTESTKMTSSCLAHTTHCVLKIYLKIIWKGKEHMQLIPCGSMHTGNYMYVWKLSCND